MLILVIMGTKKFLFRILDLQLLLLVVETGGTPIALKGHLDIEEVVS